MIQPRLKTSKKWTAFPADYTKEIQKAFDENFKDYLKNGQIFVQGYIYPEEILFQAGYLEKGRLKQCNFEISIDYGAKVKNQIMELMNTAIDASASLLLDYLETNDEDRDLPYLWKEIMFGETKIFTQFTTTNTSLEAQANALLGDEADSLLQGDIEDEADFETEPQLENEEDDDDAELEKLTPDPKAKKNLH